MMAALILEKNIIPKNIYAQLIFLSVGKAPFVR
jgi:hypothetical protein